jgi:4-hydroxybenzoate polyprenyltransferase
MSAALALLADIKVAHSVFALPFALLAAFLAATDGGSIDWSRFGPQLALIVACMVLARTVAMLSNRLLDRDIDARNPRTADRSLPTGTASVTLVRASIAVSSLAFILCCGMFAILWSNWWPLLLSVPVLAWLAAYPLLKRRTALCHIYLGLSLAMSPLAAGLAVSPQSLEQPVMWLLAAMVMCWVAGFDVIYALQDVDVDRQEGLHSIPARLGVGRALWMSRLLHGTAVAALVAIWVTDPQLGWVFVGATIVVAALLIIEHATVHLWGTSRIALTFFMLNGLVSLVLGAAGIVDVLQYSAGSPRGDEHEQIRDINGTTAVNILRPTACAPGPNDQQEIGHIDRTVSVDIFGTGDFPVDVHRQC